MEDKFQVETEPQETKRKKKKDLKKKDKVDEDGDGSVKRRSPKKSKHEVYEPDDDEWNGEPDF